MARPKTQAYEYWKTVSLEMPEKIVAMPPMVSAMLLTTSALMPGMLEMSPQRIRPNVLVIPMLEIRKTAKDGSIPISFALSDNKFAH